jgi:hypothetical protein
MTVIRNFQTGNTEVRSRARTRARGSFGNAGGAPRGIGMPAPVPAAGWITVEVADD